ncbi:MAG TPA: polysaccharide deacetylase family protein [Steroidobacteraceae bacterium]|nr:polysaccharide deacetylase family protein [Steroidobacteraceae bacterium]
MKEKLVTLAARTFARLNTRSRLTVLTFHRFGAASGITRELVKHHVQFLAEHHEFVLPRDLGKEVPRKRLAMVTVDDCHRDILDTLYPVCKELGVPFVIAVPTDFFFRNDWLWFDQLYWILERAPANVQVKINGNAYSLDVNADVQKVKALLKRMLPPERTSVLASLQQQLSITCPPAPPGDYGPVPLEQMREMLDSGLVEICAHGVSHTIATVLPPAQFAAELADSKRELEEYAGVEIPSFCYPNGEVGDFDAGTTAAVRNAGFRCALTSVEGINPSPFDPLLVKRIHAHKVRSAFEKDASGLGSLQSMFASQAAL